MSALCVAGSGRTGLVMSGQRMAWVAVTGIVGVAAGLDLSRASRRDWARYDGLGPGWPIIILPGIGVGVVGAHVRGKTGLGMGDVGLYICNAMREKRFVIHEENAF